MIDCTNGVAGGTVFKLQTNGSGFVVLKSLSGINGSAPVAPVMEASDGNLYGTTYAGGISNAGTVFKLSRDGSNFSVLHHFTGGADSANLSGSVIEGSDGYLYGTTMFGNATTRGTIFKVSKNGADYAIIHVFTGSPDGVQPRCRLLKGSVVRFMAAHPLAAQASARFLASTKTEADIPSSATSPEAAVVQGLAPD